jgi:hypothetical protein
MTNDAGIDLSGFRAAAEDAAALAQLLRLTTGQSSFYTQHGHLGVAYIANSDGTLLILVDWQRQRKLLVEQPRSRTALLRVKPYDEAGSWVQELASAVRSTQEFLDARKAKPPSVSWH